MIRIEYPEAPFRIRGEAGKEFIFDEIRKTWVRLSPEEWVRQNFLQYLIRTMNYPLKWISVEKEINLNGLRKRYDIVVYRESEPWMIIECKETGVALSSTVLDQALRYNMALPVPYIIITNGHYHYGWHKKDEAINEIDALPDY